MKKHANPPKGVVKFCVSVDHESYTWLTEEVARRKTNRSQVIRERIADAIAKQSANKSKS